MKLFRSRKVKSKLERSSGALSEEEIKRSQKKHREWLASSEGQVYIKRYYG